MRTIIAGGRETHLIPRDKFRLNRLRLELPITEVISGLARGVDTDGFVWACAAGLPITKFPANWREFGNAAGPIRNNEMARYAALDPQGGALVVFPGGAGTTNMVEAAKEHGLKVFDYRRTAR